MTFVLALLAAVTSHLSIGGTPVAAIDYLDGRAIADASGAPVVMLTLDPDTVARARDASTEIAVTLDGRQTVARIEGNAIVISGAATSFAGAAALAKALTGREPLPDSDGD